MFQQSLWGTPLASNPVPRGYKSMPPLASFQQSQIYIVSKMQSGKADQLTYDGSDSEHAYVVIHCRAIRGTSVCVQTMLFL